MNLTTMFSALLAKAQAGLFDSFEARKEHLHSETKVDRRGRVTHRWVGNEKPAKKERQAKPPEERKTLQAMLFDQMQAAQPKPVKLKRRDLEVQRGQGDLFGGTDAPAAAAAHKPAPVATVNPPKTKTPKAPADAPKHDLFDFDFSGQKPTLTMPSAPVAEEKTVLRPTKMPTPPPRARKLMVTDGTAHRLGLTQADYDAASPFIPADVKGGSSDESGYVYGVKQFYSGRSAPDGPDEGGGKVTPILNGFNAAQAASGQPSPAKPTVTQGRVTPTTLILPTDGEKLELRKRHNGNLYVWQFDRNTFELTPTNTPGVYERHKDGEVTVYRQKGDALIFDRHHGIGDEEGSAHPTRAESEGLNARTLKVGDRKTMNGKTYELNSKHRWALVEQQDAAPPKRVASIPIDAAGNPVDDSQVMVWHQVGKMWLPDRAYPRNTAERLIAEASKNGSTKKFMIGEMGVDVNATPPLTPEAAQEQLHEAVQAAQDDPTPEAEQSLRAAVKTVQIVTGEADGNTSHSIPAPQDTPAPANQAYLVGLPDGVKDKQRKAWNNAASDLIDALQLNPRETTVEERQLLARYSGNGGFGASLNEFYTPPELGEAMWKILRAQGSGTGEGLEPSSGPGVLMQFAGDDAHMDAVELSPLSAGIANTLFGHRHDVHSMSFEAFHQRNPDKTYDFSVGNPPFGPRDENRMHDEKYQSMSELSRYFTLRTLDHLKDGGMAAFVVPAGLARNKTDAAFRARVLARADIVAIHALPTDTFERAGTESATTDLWILKARPANIRGILDGGGVEALKAAGVHDDDFLTGKWHAAHPEQMHATETQRQGIGGVMMYARDGDLTPEVLANLVARTPAAPQTEHPSPDALLDALGDRPAALAGYLRDQVGKEGDTRITEDGVMQMCRGGRWHNISEKTHGALLAANQLGPVIGMHATQISHEDWDQANQLRVQLERLLTEYKAKYGNPHEDKELLNSTQHNSAVNNLLAAFTPDGEIAASITQDAASREYALDKADPDSVATYLRRQKKPLTLPNYREASGLSSDDAAAEALMGHGYCYAGTGLWKSAGDYFSGESQDIAASIHALEQDKDLPAWAQLSLKAQAAELERRVPRKSLEDLDFTPRDTWIPLASVHLYLSGKQGSPAYRLSYDDLDKYVQRDDTGKFTVTVPSFLRKDDKQALNFVKRYLTGVGRLTAENDLYSEMDEEFSAWSGNTPEHRTRIEDAYRARGAWLEPTWDTRPVQDLIPGWRGKDQGGVTLHDFQNEAIHRALQQGNGIIALDVGLGKTPTAIALSLLAKEQGLARKPVAAVPKSVVGNWRSKIYQVKPDARVLVVGAVPQLDKSGAQVYDLDGNEIWQDVTGAAALDRQLALMKTGEYDMVLMTHTTLGRVQFDAVQQLSMIEGEFYSQAADKYGRAAGMSKDSYRDYAGLKAAAMIQQGALTLDDLAKASARMKELDLLIQEQFPVGKKLSDREKQSKKEKKEEKARLTFMNTAFNALNKADAHPLATRWNELGVDHLVIDEAHNFKGLWAYQKARGDKAIKYLGAPAESAQRAVDLYYKTKAMRESNDGRGVYLLTATPIKNSPVELFNMLSYTAPGVFQRLGVHNLDQFIDRYCRVVDMTTVNEETGELEGGQVLAGLKNLSELRREVGRVINRKTAAQVGIPLPHNDETTEHIEPRQEQSDIIKWVAENPTEAACKYLNADAKIGEGAEANLEYDKIGQRYALAIPHITRRAELDMELLDSKEYKDYVSPKVQALMDELKRTVGQGQKAVVFSDVVNFPPDHGSDKPNPNGYSFHDKLKRLCAEATGIHPDQIAIVNAQTCPEGEDRLEVARGVKSGKYKVVIGNTGTMGEGISLQHGVQNLLHLDVPWNPAVWQQRVGRVLRQGNKSKSVNNKTFLGTRGLDKDMFDTLKGKGVWYDEFWNGEGDTLDADGQNDYRMTPERLKALAIDDAGEREAAMNALREGEVAAREAGKRATALKLFRRYQSGHNAITQMQQHKDYRKDKWTDNQEATLVNLKSTVADFRTRLEKHPAFTPYLDSLDNPKGVLLDPASGKVFREGQKFTVQIGDSERQPVVITGSVPRSGMIRYNDLELDGRPSGKTRQMNVSTFAGKEMTPYDQAHHLELHVAQNGIGERTDLHTRQLVVKHPDAARRGAEKALKSPHTYARSLVLRDGKVKNVGASGGGPFAFQGGDHVLLPGVAEDAAHVTAHFQSTDPKDGDSFGKVQNAEKAGFRVDKKYNEATKRVDYMAKATPTPLTALYTEIMDGAK